MYERTLGSEPRTITLLEGWHRCISSILGKVHPYIWKFLEFLKVDVLDWESLSKNLAKP